MRRAGRLVATQQPLWILVSAESFAIKLAWDDGQVPQMPWWVWLAMAAVVLPVFRLGERVQERLQERTVQRLVVALGALGALLALRTGIGLLLG